jgi:hypothetical protein
LSTNPNWLDEFRLTIDEAAARLRLLSEEEVATAQTAGKWSRKEIVGHLIDSASNNHQRFVRAQLSDDLTFPGYQQEEWIKVQSYNDEPWTQLVELWRLYNLHLWHVMSATPLEVRTRTREQHNLDQIAWETVEPSKSTTLEYFMRDYVGHLQHHLAQIFTDA